VTLVVLVAVIVGIVVAVVAPGSGKESLRDRLILFVSPHAPFTSFEDATSPQSQALGWLQGDIIYTKTELLSYQRFLQRFALATMFYSLGRGSVLEHTHECGWGGDSLVVECDIDSNVVQLYTISSGQISGTIPPELALLTRLESIDFDSNLLAGSIPPQLSSLTRLTFLDLWDNQLTGSIPPQLSSLTSLDVFDLSKNMLTGVIPPQLSTLTALTWHSIDTNQLTGTIPPQLSKLSALRVLSFSFNQLTGTIPTELSTLTALTTLYLAANQLTGTVPSGLCAIGIPEFAVDLATVECACCSCC